MPVESRLDEQLVSAYLSGEASAFERLVERYQERLIRFAWNKVKNYHDAEDVVQETWLKVWKRLPDFDDTHKFSSLLYKICSDECFNKLRQKGRERFGSLPHQPEPESEDEDIEELTFGPFKELAEGLVSRDRILAILTRPERRLWNLVVTQGRPYEAIGQEEKLFRDKTVDELRDQFGAVMDKVWAQRNKEVAKWKPKPQITPIKSNHE